MKQAIDSIVRERVGLSISLALLVPIILAALGVTVGLLFPKFEARAVLQFPEDYRAERREEFQTERREGSRAEFRTDQRPVDQKPNVIDLSAYKRVAAAYEAVTPLRAYIESLNLRDSPAASRLLQQAAGAGFWQRTATPILPFSRRDLKEFGDIKDAASNTILGVELVTDAPTPAVASTMLDLLAGYYVNAVVRERIRGWTLAGKVDAQSQEKRLLADIVRAELDIELFGRRAQDMKAIIARHPEAARMDDRQLISVNSIDGAERYLSPMAQLVGAESAVSQRRELISRWQREVKQKEKLAAYFGRADELVRREVTIIRLLPALQSLATETFVQSDVAGEWLREALLRVQSALDNFEAMRSQFGLRDSVRTGEVAGRDPLRLGALAAGLGLALLAAVAFLRATFRTDSSEVDVA